MKKPRPFVPSHLRNLSFRESCFSHTSSPDSVNIDTVDLMGRPEKVTLAPSVREMIKGLGYTICLGDIYCRAS